MYFRVLPQICTLLIIFSKTFATPSDANLKPNVLLIVVDDLRPALGIYGDKNAYTPNIDKLAKKSYVFLNAFAQQSLCAPSRNSFLTSRRPDSLHLYDFYSYWRDTVGNFTTLPQHFKENGYYTYSIGKVFHPGKSSNFNDDYPYSWSCKTFHPKTEIYKNAKVCNTRTGEKAKNLVCPVRVADQPESTLPDIESLKEGVDFLKYNKNITDGKPYFLAVGFHKPHIPLKFPREYLKYHPIDKIKMPKNTYMPATLPMVAWNPWFDVRIRDDIQALNISFPFGTMPLEETKLIIQSYAAATTYIDDLIGELLKYTDENTIVAIVGDHGVSLGEHGEFSKFSNFEIANRVPFILYIPGSDDGVLSPQMVELVDLFPTLVDLTNVSSKLNTCEIGKKNSTLCTEGRSLVPLMKSLRKRDDTGIDSVKKSAVFYQYPRPGIYPTSKPNSDKPKLKEIKIMGYTIRTFPYRYTEWVKFNTTTFKPCWDDVYAKELYNYEIDPNENLNIASRTVLNPIIKTLKLKLILGWRYA